MCLILRSLVSRLVLLLFGINVQLRSKMVVLQGLKLFFSTGVGNGQFWLKNKGLTLNQTPWSEAHLRLKCFCPWLNQLGNSISSLRIWNWCFQTLVATPSNSTSSSITTTICLIIVGFHLGLLRVQIFTQSTQVVWNNVSKWTPKNTT